MKNDNSIHPRNWSTGDGKTKNTCAPRNTNKKGKLAKKQTRLAARRLSHSATLKALPSNAAAAFKTPGSMSR